nr:iron ABC transporter [Schaalia odontolytica]
MRWATRSTWIRIAVLFGIYMLVSGAWFSFMSFSDSMDIVKSAAFLILLAILPVLAMVFGAWDGVKEGFSLLWLLAPFVCFLAPMYLFLNDSALIYGVGYSLLGFGAHGLGALVHRRRVRASFR